MKVSVNWIREINNKYQCSADPMPDGIDALVEKIGAQLGAVEEVINVGKKYEGIVVAKVIACQKHPNADMLSVCLIDDGGVVKKVKRDSKGLVQVVCGAPNVAAGQLIAWMPPGTTIPSTIGKEPYVLEARKIRGILSNGMIASPRELSLGDDHTGILVIDKSVVAGQPFAQVYGLDDYIIDIENKMFTHRPDLFGMLGIARELAGIQQHVFKGPDWYRENPPLPKPSGPPTHQLTVKNAIPNLVPRFTAVVLKDIKVGPSPLWLKVRLDSVGVKSINNIVDLSNFLMFETAQPVHIYDYDKVTKLCGGKEPMLTVRHPQASEEITILGGKTIQPNSLDMMVAAGEDLVCVGGIMGGINSEVDLDSKNIIIEAANWDMNTIRKTAMTHGLFTEAATRFTKNQNPRQNLAVVIKAIDEVKKLAGGRQASVVIDDKHFKAQPQKVSLTAEFINERLGLSLSATQIKKILENVEFKVEVNEKKLTTPQNPHLQGSTLKMLKMEVPFWRTDIEIPEDIVEEVGRLHGYNHLPLTLPDRNLAPAKINESLVFQQEVRGILAAAGANEVLTYSFVHGALIEQAGQDIKDAYHIKNALSPDLQYYRLSLTPSLLEKVHPNIKAGIDRFSLFEIGRGHVRGVVDEEKLPAELNRLALVFADKKTDKSRGAPYYQAKHYMLYLADRLGIGEFISVPLAQVELAPAWREAAKSYEPSHSAAVFSGQIFLGLIGEPTTSLIAGLKLPACVAQVELDLAALAQARVGASYEPINRFPSLEQDITLKVPVSLSYAEVVDFVSNSLDKISQPAGYRGSVGPLDIFQKPTEKNYKNITLRIVMFHPQRTLITEESNKLLDKIATEAKQKLKAERIE